MSEIHELAMIEIENKARAAEELRLPAFKWNRLIAYAKELCPEMVTPEMQDLAQTAITRYEFALMEVDAAKRFINSALRKVLREKETFGLRIEDITQADLGRRLVVLLGPKTEAVAELVGWTGTRLIVRHRNSGRARLQEVKPSRCRWAV